MLRLPLAIAALAATGAAQCQFQSIAVTPLGAACAASGYSQMFAAFSVASCSVDITFFPYIVQWLPYGSWIALGDSPQLALYPQLVGACPQLQNPVVIVPVTQTYSVPIPPGLGPMTFYACGIGLHYEPNTAQWFLAPARQGLQITLQ